MPVLAAAGAGPVDPFGPPRVLNRVPSVRPWGERQLSTWCGPSSVGVLRSFKRQVGELSRPIDPRATGSSSRAGGEGLRPAVPVGAVLGPSL